MARQVTISRPVDEAFRISSPFGAVGDTALRSEPHKGIDFACPLGTPVRSVTDGKILIQRTDADGNKAGSRIWVYDYERNIRVGYFHLREFRFPEVGSAVVKGDIIAWSGTTGNSTGPHLHIQVEELSSGAICEPIIEETDHA